jgi:glutamyl/glutaminyl-tRNA synthetase
MLFDALGFKTPEFAHLPSVLSPDGKGKLSKRHGALSLIEYRNQGYLPEALLNFMALLGWSPGNDQEFMTRREMVEMFDLARVKKTGARFDKDKLLWMNAAYIKKASIERLVELARETLKDSDIDAGVLSPDTLVELVEVYREKLKVMTELPVMARFLFVAEVDYVEKDVQDILLKGDGLLRLRQAHDALSALERWDKDDLHHALEKLATDAQVGFGKVAQPIRVALTGSKVSPGIGETLHLVGRERCLERMTRALKKFGSAN